MNAEDVVRNTRKALLESEWDALRREMEWLKIEFSDLRQKVEALGEGPEQMLWARCLRHHRVPPLNRNEPGGAECGACIQEEADRVLAKALVPANLDVEFRCIRCGSVTPWNPALEQRLVTWRSVDGTSGRRLLPLCKGCHQVLGPDIRTGPAPFGEAGR